MKIFDHEGEHVKCRKVEYVSDSGLFPGIRPTNPVLTASQKRRQSTESSHHHWGVLNGVNSATDANGTISCLVARWPRNN